MSTTYQKVYEYALAAYQDWELNAIYNSSVPNFEAIMKSYLLRAIPRFEHCKTSLSDRDDSLQIFNGTLTDIETTILSDLLVIEWLGRSIQDLNQIQLHVRDSEFNTSSEGANLKAKLELRQQLEERVDRLKTQYSLNNVVIWSDWNNGIF